MKHNLSSIYLENESSLAHNESENDAKAIEIIENTNKFGKHI